MLGSTRGELETWIIDRLVEHIDARFVLTMVQFDRSTGGERDVEIHRIEPDAPHGDVAKEMAATFDEIATARALEQTIPCLERFVVFAKAADSAAFACFPFIAAGKVGWTPALPESEGELCARVVDRLEAGKSPIEIVRELRQTLKVVMAIHKEWTAAKRAHVPQGGEAG